MNKIALIVILFSNSLNVLGQEAPCEHLKTAENELESNYQSILVAYSEDSVFVEKLAVAQESWLAFRDAHLESVYPENDKRYYGGVYPNCRCSVLLDLTRTRNGQLLIWLEGMEEGEVCAGSVKFKDD